MSRSPYYPRRGARILTKEPKQALAKASKSGHERVQPCAICHADLPIIQHDGLYYLQAPLGFICQAIQAEVCPWKFRMEVGTAKEL